MKKTDKKKPIATIPSGVWESSRPKNKADADKSTRSTDAQWNGYPTKNNKK